MNTTEQFAELMHCPSLDAWRNLVFKLALDLGYERTLLAVLPGRNTPVEAKFAFLHSNYSTDWRNRYDAEKMHLVDPTFTHCINKSIPLIWSPDIFTAGKSREMYEEACTHGLKSGITLPIHGAQGELGLLCFVTDTNPGKNFQRDAMAMLPALACLRDFVYESSLRYIKSSRPADILPPVTPRELECLKWCAVGKSSWDTAQILRCSEATINFHFSNMRRKFGVSSRQQVVVKAMRSGLFQL